MMEAEGLERERDMIIFHHQRHGSKAKIKIKVCGAPICLIQITQNICLCVHYNNIQHRSNMYDIHASVVFTSSIK